MQLQVLICGGHKVRFCYCIGADQDRKLRGFEEGLQTLRILFWFLYLPLSNVFACVVDVAHKIVYKLFEDSVRDIGLGRVYGVSGSEFGLQGFKVALGL